MEYSTLNEMMSVPGIDPSSTTQPALALARVHAVRVSDGRVVHPYNPQASDVARPDRDWMKEHPGERCARCAKLLGTAGSL
jgi:hypothetical protein